MDTLCNICSPEDFVEEVLDDNREEITGVGEGFSEMFLKERENLVQVLTYMEEFDFKELIKPLIALWSSIDSIEN